MICFPALWWAYSVSMSIKGGYYQPDQARSLVAEMASIVTALTAIVWLMLTIRRRLTSGWRRVCIAIFWTATALVGYTALVVIRRSFWTPAQSPESAFLPILGHVNGKFFSESRWLSFLIDIVPTMSITSGCLYFVFVQLAKPVPRVPLTEKKL